MPGMPFFLGPFITHAPVPEEVRMRPMKSRDSCVKHCFRRMISSTCVWGREKGIGARPQLEK